MMFSVPEGPKEDTLSPVLTALIDKALVAHTKKVYEATRGSGVGNVAYKRIGSGYIGVECARQLAYKYHKAEKEPREKEYVSPGELQRHAEAGFWTETKTAEWLKLAGFDIKTGKADGSQFGYLSCPDENGQARLAGELDGVILSGPTDKLPYPILWESKKATAKKFRDFSRNGVKESDSKYYGQLQTNMLEMEVYFTLFSMLNLDTMEYYFEVIPFDAAHAQRLQDRAANVLASQSPEELPRITDNPADFRCKFCDYTRRCHQKPEKPKNAEPAVPFFLRNKPPTTPNT